MAKKREAPATQEERAVQEAAAPTAHSKIVGGSNAARLIACPGSHQLISKLPRSANRSSIYADEGTAMHAAMAYLIENDITDAYEIEGMEFAGHEEDDGSPGTAYVMTKELIRDGLMPALAYFDKVIDEYGTSCDDLQWRTEQRIEMPGIPESFGTGDVVMSSVKLRRTDFLDWKFGVGVPVKAVYVEVDDEGEYEKPNAQLMYYGRSTMHTHPGLFGGSTWADIPDDWKIVLHIVQPRARVRDEANEDAERYTRVEVTKAELEEFRMALVRAAAEATGKDPRLARGDHCRFCPAKTICPKWTGPMLDVGRLAELAQGGTPQASIAEFFAAALDFGDMVDEFLTELRKQAHDLVQDGGKIAGWKLAPLKSKGRVWRADEDIIVDVVEKALDYAPDVQEVLYKPAELRSPKQLEDELKARGVKKLPTFRDDDGKEQELATMAPSSGTKLVRETNPSDPVIPRGEIVQGFAKLIAGFSATS